MGIKDMNLEKEGKTTCKFLFPLRQSHLLIEKVILTHQNGQRNINFNGINHLHFSALVNFKRQDQNFLIRAFNFFEGLSAFKCVKVPKNKRSHHTH